MDFWAPPEITSALIHSGPGAGSWFAAANVWGQLAFELQQTAADYTSTVASISWQGPSATAMTLSTIPYVGWMHTTAAKAAQMSMAATTMASSFVATQAAVVHPSVVAANRAQLAHLLATNFFGINFPAIAATDAQYLQMWAANTTAMLGYHATRLQTMTLQRFTSPPTTTNPTGVATQSAAVTTAQAINLPTDPIFENPTIALLLVHEESVIQSGFPFNFISSFTGGHDFLPGQYPDVLAPSPRNLAIAYNLTGPEAVGGAPNFYGPAAAETSAVQASYTASLGKGMYVGNLVVPPSAVTSPIQLTAAEGPLVATSADGAPLIPAFVPPMPPGARKAQRDKPDEKGYGPPIPGTIMRRPPSGG